jgi:glycosyltransferase involved in cell wall biosynthesis
MRIAVIAPLVEAVPPERYGGTERVVSVLTEELVRRGHQVTLFASSDSRTSAELISSGPRSLRVNGDDLLPAAWTLLQLSDVFASASEFDIIHNHVDWPAFPFARLAATPTVSTMHGRLDLPSIRNTFGRFPEQPLVSISRAQSEYLPGANWLATVHNGIALDHFHFQREPGDYLVFLGRISPEKRPDRAIEIAGRAGMRLVIAAKVDPVDRDYYECEIAPLVHRSPWVEFIGEVDEAEKDELLGHAYAYLFPIDWPEPFGLTMVEAMATGTPVIAARAGSVPEVVHDGVTGFICDDTVEMARAVEDVSRLNRASCRLRVEQCFSAQAMTDGYEAVYRRLAGRDRRASGQLFAGTRVNGAASPAVAEAGHPAAILMDDQQ